MRKLRKINVPNVQHNSSQSIEPGVTINKKKIRRFILVFIFIFSTAFYLQYILYKQETMIKEKQKEIQNQQQQVISLKKDGEYLKKEVGNLTDNEEQILKFARKEYHFSKPNETVFVIPK
ncbi:septum formation initiator family protein [Bacillus sp. DX1.1]|uniref:FtsB family cell division protein n=1 Tax=unclassified Bacillus (in: firmicutes) TaxID=185979 RepID=UPI0025712E3D|nr:MULTISPECIES: septum formation initiator family protein [unclassified Bacillus (in: firmicutes)]MDM5155207.1 septum formation initiator family protein [Bacillus sp. DX1.1]WJE79528.1 septum formation initiator family protein [Bacillus sp. DX3.1]